MKHKDMEALMGQVVVVEKTLSRVVKKREASWVVDKVYGKPRPGWIVGFRYLQYGHIVDNGWEDAGGFKQSGKTILATLVSYWPTMVPEKVPAGGYRLANEDEKPYFDSHRWSERDRRAISKDVRENAKRDSKGRFKG